MLSFGEQKGYPNDSTGAFEDNIVYAVSPIGDKMGKGIGSIRFDGNAFYNITPKWHELRDRKPKHAADRGLPGGVCAVRHPGHAGR